MRGGRWDGRLASRYLITDHVARRAIAQQCHVLLCNGLISEVDQIRSAMELVMASNESSLLVVAKEIGGAALGTLAKNHQEGNLKAIAVEFNHPETKRREDFEDLAILTRGRVFVEEIGHSLRSLTKGDLGTARRVEADAADAEELVVIGDDGNSAGVRVAAYSALFVTLDKGTQDDIIQRTAHKL